MSSAAETMVSVCEGNGVAGLLSGFWRCARGRPGAARLSALLGTCPSNAMVERKGREGREEILVFFAAFAAFAFNRDVPCADGLLPEFLERELAIVLPEKIEEPLVIARLQVEHPGDDPVVAARVFESLPDHLPERPACNLAIHVERVDARPERFAFLREPPVEVVGDGAPPLPLRPEGHVLVHAHISRQV